MKMKSLKILSLLLPTLIFSEKHWNPETIEFEKKHILLQPKPELKPIAVNPAEPIEYHRAFKLPDAKYEIRIRYEPMALILERIEAVRLLKPDGGPFSEDGEFVAVTQDTIHTIAGTRSVEISTSNPKKVKTAQNGDAGFSALVTNKSEFGKDYKYILIVATHHHKFGNIYLFMLQDDLELGGELMRKYLRIVKFRD